MDMSIVIINYTIRLKEQIVGFAGGASSIQDPVPDDIRNFYRARTERPIRKSQASSD